MPKDGIAALFEFAASVFAIIGFAAAVFGTPSALGFVATSVAMSAVANTLADKRP